MTEILPPEQDDFFLQRLGAAYQEGKELDQVAPEITRLFEWNEHQYGQAVQRLMDQGWIKGDTQKNATGKYMFALPTEVTTPGWHRIKQLRANEDPS